MPQILLYDEKEMHVFEVKNYYLGTVEFTSYSYAPIEDNQRRISLIPEHTYKAEITIGEVKAELDPTTMKRIAKYNLDKDFEKLNRQIKSAEERLKNLNEQVEEKEQKLELMKTLFPKIWNDADFDQDNYLPDEDCDYEEDGRE